MCNLVSELNNPSMKLALQCVLLCWQITTRIAMRVILDTHTPDELLADWFEAVPSGGLCRCSEVPYIQGDHALQQRELN
jgi:hypothetical protein